MKKLSLFVIAIAWSVAANAQAVYGYGINVGQGTYSEIDGTTILVGTNDNVITTVDQDGEEVNNMTKKVIYSTGIYGTYEEGGETVDTFTEQGYEIGFTFKLAGVDYTHFAVGTDGVIYFGNGTITTKPDDGQYLFTRSGNDNFIACLAKVGVIAADDTKISYTVIGDAPNRALIVQYKNWAWCQSLFNFTPHKRDMQIRLYEANNNFDIVFNNCTTLTRTLYARCGVKQGGVIKTIYGDTDEGYEYSYSGTDDFAVDSNFADGTTVSFTYPTDCTTPTSQPTDLILKSSSTDISIAFTATDADMYLITYTTADAADATPVNGTTYAAGDQIGNSTVLAYTTQTNSTLYDGTTSTAYTFNIYAVNAYGFNGPVYNTTSPLTSSIYTHPAAPTVLTISDPTYDSVTLSATSNAAGNNILVAYSTQLIRSSFGDYAAIGDLSGEYNAGDELTYTFEGVDYTGKVAYYGPSVENYTVTGLNHSTGYHFVAFCHDTTSGYSTESVSEDIATISMLPYTADFSTGKSRNSGTGLPPGWTDSEPTKGYVQVENGDSNTSTEGWFLKMFGSSGAGNATDGAEFIANLPGILIDKRAATVSYEYSWYINSTRFLKLPYVDWAEGDKVAIQISTDGTNYEDLAAYDSTNRPEVAELAQFSKLEGDLSKYEGQIVYLRVYWKSYAYDYFKQPGTLVVKNLTIDGREIPATPEVLVNNITHISATVKWIGQQTNYEVAYGKVGEEFTTQIVEGEAETANTLQLTDLVAETEYQVKVRGIAGENDYSNWSEVKTFTTAAWPECAKPTNLQANLDNFLTDGSVVLTWEGNDEQTSWEVRYRESTSTSYAYVNDLVETTTTLNGLNHSTSFLWSVRANCTADRITAWSAQGNFETPVVSSISLATADDITVTSVGNSVSVINGNVYVNTIEVYDLSGRLIAAVEVNGYDNAIIPVNGTDKVVLVKVSGMDNTFTYKVAIR